MKQTDLIAFQHFGAPPNRSDDMAPRPYSWGWTPDDGVSVSYRLPDGRVATVWSRDGRAPRPHVPTPLNTSATSAPDTLAVHQMPNLSPDQRARYAANLAVRALIVSLLALGASCFALVQS